jgi:hypothetical protein
MAVPAAECSFPFRQQFKRTVRAGSHRELPDAQGNKQGASAATPLKPTVLFTKLFISHVEAELDGVASP